MSNFDEFTTAQLCVTRTKITRWLKECPEDFGGMGRFMLMCAKEEITKELKRRNDI